MKCLKLLFASIAFFIPSIGLSQSLGYADADNSGQALGMMWGSIYGSQLMLKECTSRFPDLKEQMDTNLSAWKKNEDAVLKKAEYYWAQQEQSYPQLKEVRKRADIAIKGLFGTFYTMSPDEPHKIISDFCQQYFADLASGIWRKRTPKTYAFMDEFPDPPKIVQPIQDVSPNPAPLDVQKKH